MCFCFSFLVALALEFLFWLVLVQNFNFEPFLWCVCSFSFVEIHDVHWLPISWIEANEATDWRRTKEQQREEERKKQLSNRKTRLYLIWLWQCSPSAAYAFTVAHIFFFRFLVVALWLSDSLAQNAIFTQQTNHRNNTTVYERIELRGDIERWFSTFFVLILFMYADPKRPNTTLYWRHTNKTNMFVVSQKCIWEIVSMDIGLKLVYIYIECEQKDAWNVSHTKCQ